MTVFSVSKSLNRVKKIPIVWLLTVPSLGFHCSRDMLCDFSVVWMIQNELLDLLIDPCELIFYVIVMN